MPPMLRPLPFVVLLCLLAGTCGDEATSPQPSPVSILSYIAEIYDADYVSGAQPPTPSVPATLGVSRGDTTLGRGSTFSLTLSHPAGMRELIVGAKNAIGYYLVRPEGGATETMIRGRLSGTNWQDFTFQCSARGTDGSVLTPAEHPLNVLSSESVRYYITDVVGATYVDAELPLPTKGVTITDVTGDSVIVNGGSMAVSLACVVPASAVVVGIPPARGYFHLPTTGLPGDVGLVILVAQSAPTNFVIQFLTEEVGPEYGTVASFAPSLIHVGTGDLQVSLAFRPSQDVDLHLVEPTGEEIYYGALESTAGGRLDLDSNPSCRLDHKNNENITYDEGAPPTGQYIVRVDFWESCDGGGADYRVVVAVKGDITIHSGHFESYEADGGGAGSGREVCRFTF
ncbi:MAG: hypothetical protein MUE60_12830 [Candidatus Eisenbacteria bacterium]|nr:hypothetical protein [Candidatus Eisenbacteria bacterium]